MGDMVRRSTSFLFQTFDDAEAAGHTHAMEVAQAAQEGARGGEAAGPDGAAVPPLSQPGNCSRPGSSSVEYDGRFGGCVVVDLVGPELRD
jgi:hypothetical protein